jgi:hypothetical protein
MKVSPDAWRSVEASGQIPNSASSLLKEMRSATTCNRSFAAGIWIDSQNAIYRLIGDGLLQAGG